MLGVEAHLQKQRGLRMAFPSSLAKGIEAAQQVMTHHSLSNLEPGYRQAIYAALGPRITSEQSLLSEGLIRRVHLATLSIQHVLPM